MTVTALRRLRLALWTLVGAAALAALWFGVVQPRMQTDITASLGRGDYRLETTEGAPFTEASLRGAPSAVFFGFTHCPDVCPTTLADIQTWKQELGPDGDRLRVFFVTVDPARDTAGALRDYVSWVPGVVGVTGSEAEMAKAIRAFRIYANRVPLEGGDYTMDHTAYVMLFDGRGRFDQVVDYQEPLDRALGKLRRLLGA